MDKTEPLLAARVSAHATVGAQLSLLSDRRLGDAVAAAPALGSGIGGRRGEMEVAGLPVFVKRVPLTDIESRPEHVRSTANLFELPLYYQYGVGSAGFGAWRELAAHVMTTTWVLKGEFAGFPLMYHWRVLPDRPPADFADEFGGVEGAVAHWEGSPAVRHRLEAIGKSSSAWCSSWSTCLGHSRPGSMTQVGRLVRSRKVTPPTCGWKTPCCEEPSS